MQDLFVRLLAQASTVDAADDKQIAGWVLTTSTDLALTRLRHRPRDDADWEREVRTVAGRTNDLEALLDRPEFSRRVLADLDRRTQEVVVLVHFEGLTSLEAARALNLPVFTVEEELARYREVAGARLAGYRREPASADAGGEA